MRAAEKKRLRHLKRQGRATAPLPGHRLMPRQSYGDASGQGGPSFHRRSQAVPLPPSPQRTPTLRAAATASPARERRVHLPAGLTPERLRQSSSSGPRLFPEKVAGIVPQLPQSQHRFPRRRTGGWLGPARRLLRKPPASPGERAAPAGIKIKTTQPQIHGHSKCEAKEPQAVRQRPPGSYCRHHRPS